MQIPHPPSPSLKVGGSRLFVQSLPNKDELLIPGGLVSSLEKQPPPLGKKSPGSAYVPPISSSPALPLTL